MKKVLLVLLVFILITGCSSQVEVEVDSNVEENKLTYLEIKDNLATTEDFTNIEDILFTITASIDRISEEEISYRIIIDNPEENMNEIEALLIHNNFSEDIFPSIGIFDDKTNLIMDSNDLKGIELVGYIETTKELSDLDIELRLWLKYMDDNNNEKEIYYKIDNIEYNDIKTQKDNSTQDVIVE